MIDDSSAASLLDRFRESGVRPTPQRQFILGAVRELGRATPEQILDQVHLSAAAVNVATIYRTLDLFERLGLVTHHHQGHGAPTYTEEVAADVRLVCDSCGAVVELPSTVLDDVAGELARDRGFRLDPSHVPLPGRCRACSASDGDPTGR